MKNKLITAVIAALILAIMPVSAFAQGYDSSRTGSISVTLTDPENGAPIPGAQLCVYYVATVRLNQAGNLAYTYTPEFSTCGIALNDRSLASKLDSYVLSASLSSRQATTDSNGRAVFSNLPLGLYFVKQINSVRGYADCRSFIVTVPYKTGITYNYEINASPKTDTERLVDITIKKVWNTDESTPITDSVTVHLLRDGNLVATAILSEQNNWQMRFLDMPQSDAYSVLEAEVPQGFTATYTQNGLEFTVTNTSALIDAGQLVWPIPILAMAGMLLIAVGYVLLRKSSNQNG